MSVTTKIEPNWFPYTVALKMRAVVVRDEDSMKIFLRVGKVGRDGPDGRQGCWPPLTPGAD